MTAPAETLIVTFFETPVRAVRHPDGTIYLAIRDLCDSVGLDLTSQLRRLRRDADLSSGVHTFRVVTAGGPQDQDFLILEYIPTWITTVNRNKSTPIVSERLRYLRLFIIREVYDAITRAAGLPSGSSRNIESLDDLQRFDETITGLAERQRALEDSLDKARQAWKDHEDRLRRLEGQKQQGSVISNAQRGHIYNLVHKWAEARVEKEELPFGQAIAGCWATIKRRYDVAKYEHLPASEYESCVALIKQSYKRLTGEELSGEQMTLPDLDG